MNAVSRLNLLHYRFICGLIIALALAVFSISMVLNSIKADSDTPLPYRPAHCARVDMERVYGPYGDSELVCRVNAPETFDY